MLSRIALICLLCLLAVWVIYPLIMAALAALLSRHPLTEVGSEASSEPRVSVVLATRDELEAVRARVADLARTEYDPARMDIIVARDRRAGPIATEDLRVEGLRVTSVEGDEPGGKAATLNAGVRAATGEVVVFTDTNQRFLPDAIRRLCRAVGQPRVGASSGRLELAPSAGRLPSPAAAYWSLERWLRRHEAAVHSAIGVTGAIYAMRRSLWTPLPAGLILDDVYTPMRLVLAGHRVTFVDEARAMETRRTASGQEYRRKVRTLTGVLQLCAWLPDVLVPIRNPVWIQFVFHKLLRLLTPYWVLGVALWSGIFALRALADHPDAGLVLLASLLLITLLTSGRPLRAARAIVVEGLLIQVAIVVATANGVRGRWDVWHN
ncbi:MAG: glycosyltransferase [Gemmatimonadaceae bacterium]